MIQRIRGNEITNWQEALRRAALPALRDSGTPQNPTLSGPARAWRACKLADHPRTGFSSNSAEGIDRG